MKEVQDIPLTQNYHLIGQKEKEQLVKKEIGENKLRIFLSWHMKGKGANVEGYELKEINFASENSGDLTLTMKVNYYNACLNIDDYEKEDITVGFEMLHEKNILRLILPQLPERGMDEI
jgi:hypothetical protein